MNNADKINEMLERLYPLSDLKAKPKRIYGTTLECIEIYDKDILQLTIENTFQGWTFKSNGVWHKLEFINDIYNVISH